jgi:hypothetical protein
MQQFLNNSQGLCRNLEFKIIHIRSILSKNKEVRDQKEKRCSTCAALPISNNSPEPRPIERAVNLVKDYRNHPRPNQERRYKFAAPFLKNLDDFSLLNPLEKDPAHVARPLRDENHLTGKRKERENCLKVCSCFSHCCYIFLLFISTGRK